MFAESSAVFFALGYALSALTLVSGMLLQKYVFAKSE